MKTPLLVLAGALFATSTAFAQGAAGTGAGGSAAGAAGTGGSAGEGYKQNAGAGGANTASIPGWSAMNAQERGEMQQRMQSFRNYNECQSFMSQQASRMRSRAPDAAPAAGDPCAHLPRS